MSHPLVASIQENISKHPVVIYMKGTAQFPQCGFSAKAVQVLRAAGVESPVSVDLLENAELWDALDEVTQWPTSPQVFIHGKFIGGCDIVTEMFENGELQELLAQKSLQ